ncbi:tripartite motif-containing protein 2 [Lingula anatina]|uniref:Tripartite motif-containing protein 2 n=1 Tax=Lingula anatina TaxID=7574 RepID=A0A1S3IMY7_LINAN|nr:tripartite motif-containing protein 2 [Lingula anatina]XP_013399448.1 tripartite motif-containing protein 2 [Lingula anatina]|eukprot:XP_013399447.1 tripartite motif-containing protein 2 [Lingula anatina]
MATAVPECAEDFLYCQICTEPFRRPKALPCLHTFCQGCLESYATTQHAQETGHFPCPVCRKPAVIGVAGVQSLPDNFIMNKVADILRKLFFTTCDICKAANKTTPGKAKSRCFQCDKKMCEDCSNTHIQVPITSSHSLEPLYGVNENKCTIHENETLKYYCVSHSVCICVPCTMIEHRSCEINEIQTIKNAEISVIQDLLNKCEKKISELEVIEDKSSLNISSLRQQINDVEMKMANLRQDMEGLDNQLKEEQAQKCQAMFAIQHLSQLKSYSTSILSQEDPVKLLAVAKQVQQQLTDCLQHSTLSDQTTPKMGTVSTRSISSNDLYLSATRDSTCITALKYGDTLTELIRRFTTSKLANESQFLGVAMTSSGVIALSDAANEIVKMFDQYGNILGTHDIKAEVLTSTENSFICINYDCNVGKESQFVVLNTHGRVMKETNIAMTFEPSGITTSQNRDIFVAFDNNTMVQYNMEGKEQQQIILKVSRTARKGFQSCVPSLLVDDNLIYACDTQQNCVNVYNMEGSLNRSIGSYGNGVSELSFPESMCFHGNKLLVCDHDNNRISMFHKEGQFLGQLLQEADGIQKPKNVCLFPDDRLLVVQRKRDAIEFLIFQVNWDSYQD